MEKKETTGGLEIDMRHILLVIRKRILLILVVGILFGGIAYGYAKLTKEPTYSSSVMFYVNNQYPGSYGHTNTQLMAAHELAKAYIVILETRDTLEEVNTQAGLNYSYSQMKKMVSAEIIDETAVFRVTFTSPSADDAYKLAVAVEDVLQRKIYKVVKGSAPSTQEGTTPENGFPLEDIPENVVIGNQTSGDNSAPLSSVDSAKPPKAPSGPNYSRYALLGVACGVLLSLFMVMIRDLLDNTVRSEEYLANTYEDVPLLAVIPTAENNKVSHYSTDYRKGNTRGGAR